MHLIDEHAEELSQACEDAHVKELYAFGSVLTDQFDAESDLDFIVAIDEPDPLEYTELYFRLKFALEEIFGRKIDLLEQKAMRNQVFQRLVDRKKHLIYAREGQRLAE